MPSTQNQRHYTAAEWSSYADRELPSVQQQEMQSHLAECAECRALARSYDAVQRGAEELARSASPPPVSLRTRVLAVGATLAERQQTRGFWLTMFALTLFAATVLAGVWMALHRETQPNLPPVVVEGANAKKILFSLDLLSIEPLLMTSSLYYEVTIENKSATPLEITTVKVSDPFGNVERKFEPPVTVPAGTRLVRHGFSMHEHLADNEKLRDGIYRIEITTNLGSFSAERVILSPEKR